MSETKTTGLDERTYSEWCKQQDREALKVLEKERDQARVVCAQVRNYAHGMSAIGYKEGITGAHILALMDDCGQELLDKLAQYESQEQSMAIWIGSLEKEIEQLNKALALKLDAIPSGLSAGQSMGMEKQICQLRNEVQKLEGKNDGLAQALREALRYVSDSEPALRLKLVLEGGQIDYSRQSALQLLAYREQLTKIDNILHPGTKL